MDIKQMFIWILCKRWFTNGIHSSIKRNEW